MARKRPRRSGKLREQFVNPPSMPPELFHALFIDENPKWKFRAIKEIGKVRKQLRAVPFLVETLGLSPVKAPHRPKKSYTLDPLLSMYIAMSMEWGGLKPSEVCKALGKRIDHQALRRLRLRGQEIFRGASKRDLFPFDEARLKILSMELERRKTWAQKMLRAFREKFPSGPPYIF